MTTTESGDGPWPEPAIDRLVLSGPPAKLRATVPVANPSTTRLTVRDLVLRRSGVDAIGVPFAAIVAPGGLARVPLTVGLPLDTPPGDYPAEIDVAGESRPALLRVEPTLEMTLTPSVLLATPGRHEFTVTAASRANVEIPLAATTKGRARDGDAEHGPDIVLTLDAATVLQPGETLRLIGWLDVPANLDPQRRHIALVPIGLADLRVVVLPGATPPPP